jgi:hypothetical protein
MLDRTGAEIRYGFTPDGAHLGLAVDGQVWDVDAGSGQAGPVCRVFSPVVTVERLSADRLALFTRLRGTNGEIDLYRRDPAGRWELERLLPVMAFDQLCWLRLDEERTLLVLSFQHMPEEEDFCALVLERGEQLISCGQHRVGIKSGWVDGEGAYLRSSADAVYRVDHLSRVEAPDAPMVALVYDVPPGQDYGRRQIFALRGGLYGAQYGFVDGGGQLAIAPRFSGGFGFSGGLARVQATYDHQWGVIDRQGAWVLPPHHCTMGEIVAGCVPIGVGGESNGAGARWGLRALDGRWLLEPVHDQVGALVPCGERDALPARVTPAGGRQRFVAADGTLLPGEYEAAGDFGEGLAPVQRGGKWGFIDARGELVIDHRYLAAKPMQGGLAGVELERGKWGFVDRAGEVVSARLFDEVQPHTGGFAPVRLAGRWGYVDDRGQVAGEIDFDAAFRFVDGMACVVRGGKGSFVDTSIRLLGEGWDTAFEPVGGFGVIQHGGKRNFVDVRGELLCAEWFEGAYSFNERHATVRRGGKWGAIDERGAWVIEPSFEDARALVGGLMAVQVGGLWGFANLAGELVVQPAFEEVYAFCDGLALVSCE